ncbi:MAG: hypothetical protein NTV82_13580 [Candidatus Aminicenantes bacterium]|jgi:hypothetical protein|nr:hypothetical protein [Candidatus Aminicenantes bacterium]
MSKHQSPTDQIKKVQLPSAIQCVLWTVRRAAPGGSIGLEIYTQFVGNGSKIEIELSDQNGKTFGKYAEKISGNRFWTQIKVPAEAKQALYADVKLPKHGLQMKSNPLIVLPPIEITNAKWDKKEARRGDILKLTADVKGVQDGTEGEIEIWEHDSDDAHDFITKFPVLVKNSKVEADWEYEYFEDTDEIPTEEELKKYGNKYNPPEYFFRVKFGELAADSGLLEFKDWIEIELFHESREPISGAKYVIKLADGSEIQGTLDDKGYAKVDGVIPGSYVLNFPEFEEEP